MPGLPPHHCHASRLKTKTRKRALSSYLHPAKVISWLGKEVIPHHHNQHPVHLSPTRGQAGDPSHDVEPAFHIMETDEPGCS